MTAGPPHGGGTAFFQGDEATMLAHPEMDGAVPAIARLLTLFSRQVWPISRCSPGCRPVSCAGSRTVTLTTAPDSGPGTSCPAGPPGQAPPLPATRPDSLRRRPPRSPHSHPRSSGPATLLRPQPTSSPHTAPTWAELETNITNSVTSYTCRPSPNGVKLGLFGCKIACVARPGQQVVAGDRLADRIGVGVLAKVFPPELVDRA